MFGRPKCFFDISVDGYKVGRIVFSLYSDTVPQTCENFRCLCTGECGNDDSGQILSYKGSMIYCIYPNYLCQGGDIINNDGSHGTSIYGETFPVEDFIISHNKRGILSMVNNGTNSNNSQFIITLSTTPWLNHKYVAFGTVVDGFNILDTIEKYGSNSGNTIKTVKIVSCGQLLDGITLKDITIYDQLEYIELYFRDLNNPDLIIDKSNIYYLLEKFGICICKDQYNILMDEIDENYCNNGMISLEDFKRYWESRRIVYFPSRIKTLMDQKEEIREKSAAMKLLQNRINYLKTLDQKNKYSQKTMKIKEKEDLEKSQNSELEARRRRTQELHERKLREQYALRDKIYFEKEVNKLTLDKARNSTYKEKISSYRELKRDAEVHQFQHQNDLENMEQINRQKVKSRREYERKLKLKRINEDINKQRQIQLRYEDEFERKQLENIDIQKKLETLEFEEQKLRTKIAKSSLSSDIY